MALKGVAFGGLRHEPGIAHHFRRPWEKFLGPSFFVFPDAIRKGCQEGLSASALLDRIIGEVKVFAEDVPQGDDPKVVILEVEA